MAVVKRFPPEQTPFAQMNVYDSLLQRGLTREEAVDIYGAAVYALSRRRLSKQEMKQLPIPIDLQ